MLNHVKNQIEAKMLKTVQYFCDDLRGVRTGRASSSLFNGISVNLYGGSQKLNQIASVSAIDHKTLLINIWDINAVSEVKTAILNAHLNVNPVVEGNMIRISLPELTQEHRHKLVKLIYKYAENARISIRNIRRDIMEEIEKIEHNKKISEDELHCTKKEIQGITDHHIQQINNTLSIKEQEILNN
ncbi:ribosome recycling factor [Wolbachia endosymbiont of Howardula sp.]|uniref:ribosome recycling factor n=1 Tax=Wolbachia endosymbiont of Howardula sp. TaxID=2916816 RepID=UPI00217EF28E|nr:ribosome recycling factor [Wolbachia endosymbiont of Howardula sp.]UWI83079.1 ribosome recycling factor [Wolbachia endosymbiont of Howardula sp.]